MVRLTYDPAKREQTLRERGLDFEDAPLVWNALSFTGVSMRPHSDEERFITVGPLRGKLVVVVWTERQNGRYILSMRRAGTNETKRYQKALEESG